MSVYNKFDNLAYGLSSALINVFPAPIISKRAPTTSDMARLGTEWVDVPTNAVYFLSSIVSNSANWVNISGGSGSFTNLSVSGTLTVGTGAQQANLSNSGLVTVAITIPEIGSGIDILSGSMLVENSLNNTSGAEYRMLKARGGSSAGLPIVTGDQIGLITFEGYDGTEFVVASQIISVSSGTITTNQVGSDLEFYTHPASSVTVSTLRMTIGSTGAVTIAAPDSGVALTITAGGQTITSGNLLVTTGNITATAGQVVGATLVSTGDVTGVSSQTAITNVTNTTQGSGTLTIKSASANSGNNTGFIKIYISGTVNYIPYFTTIAP